MEGMGAAHFIFIPSVLLVGIVIGWLLGARAARDAYAAELRRRERRQRPADSTQPAEGRQSTADSRQSISGQR